MSLTNTRVNVMRDRAFNNRGQPVVYKVPASESTNFKTGAISRSWTEHAIGKALIGPEKRGEVRSRQVSIRSPDLPSTPPSTRHVVSIDGEDWEVVSWKHNQTGYVYVIELHMA